MSARRVSNYLDSARRGGVSLGSVLLLASAMGLGGGGCSPATEAGIGTSESAYHGATPSAARPEVGAVVGPGGAGTATLIAPDVAITAAHVAEAARGGTFIVTAPDGRQHFYGIDRVDVFFLYPLSKLPVDDIALLFLRDEVPSGVARPAHVAARTARDAPPERIKAFGHGGTNCVWSSGKVVQSDPGPKREVHYWWHWTDLNRTETPNALACPGDSGGPHFGDDDDLLYVSSTIQRGAGDGPPTTTKLGSVGAHTDWLLGQLDCHQRGYALGRGPLAACDGCRCYDGVELGGRAIPSRETFCGKTVQGQDGGFFRCEGGGWRGLGGTPCGAGTELGGRNVDGRVGERVCGQNRHMFVCEPSGWRDEGTVCGGGQCRCDGGVRIDGSVVTAAETQCGTSVCGSDGAFYGCGPGGWARPGALCSSVNDLPCRGLSRTACEDPGNAARCGWYSGSSSCWPRGTPSDVAQSACVCAGGALADGVPIPVHETHCNRQVFGRDFVSYRCTGDGWRPDSLL